MKLSASFAVFLATQILLTAARPFGDAEGYTPRGSLRARQNNRQQGNNNFNQNGGNRFGGQNGGNRFGGNRGGNNNSASRAASSTVAASRTTTTAAAATTSAVRNNNQNQGNNNGNNGANAGNNGATTTAAAATTSAVRNNNQNQGNNNGNNGANTGNNGANAGNNGANAGNNGANAGNNGANAGNNGANAGNNTGNNGNNNNGGDLQSSLTLDPKLIGPNLAQNGQGGTPEAGQVPSLTSTNNYINFCASVNQPITNGLQQAGGSCNPVPMGQIPAKQNVPSCKFVFPKNGQTIAANKDFTIQLAVKGFITGNFVNPNTNYFSAPQQLQNGQILGHGHAVIEKLTSLDQTTPTDPNVFAFFKGLNAAAVNGVLTATVTGGLPAGFYKVSSINTAANHQPVIGPVAQHGSFDDVSYFTVQ